MDVRARDRLKPVLKDWQLPPTDLWAVLPARRTASAKARAFASFVQEVMDQAGDKRP